MIRIEPTVPAAGWRVVRFGHAFDRVKRTGEPDLEPLSVFLDAGVVPRSARADNHNQLGGDLSKYLVVEPGDLVFNKLRTWQGGFGASAYRGIVSPAYFVCRPNHGVVSRFADYLLHSAPYLAELTRVSKWQPPSQFDIPWEQLRLVPLHLPPERVQRQIAEFLDEECVRISELLAQLEATSNTVISSHFERLRRMVLEDDFPFVPLKHYARTGTGHTPSRERPDYWISEERVIPWFTLSDVNQIRDGRREVVTETVERITEAGVANSSAAKHPPGTVLLSRTASVGFAAVMGVEMAVSQDFMTWTCGPDLDPHYLLVALKAMQPELRRLMHGSTHKTIYMPDLHALRVPLPSLERQREIVAEARSHADAVWPLVDEVKGLGDLLREYRESLITETVSGGFGRGAVASTDSEPQVAEPAGL